MAVILQVSERRCVPRGSLPQRNRHGQQNTPTMVPVTTEPFFISIVTVSFVSFIRKRTSFMVAFLPPSLFTDH
jgi:hypothetical protein